MIKNFSRDFENFIIDIQVSFVTLKISHVLRVKYFIEWCVDWFVFDRSRRDFDVYVTLTYLTCIDAMTFTYKILMALFKDKHKNFSLKLEEMLMHTVNVYIKIHEIDSSSANRLSSTACKSTRMSHLSIKRQHVIFWIKFHNDKTYDFDLTNDTIYFRNAYFKTRLRSDNSFNINQCD